jgi:uncharacterized C2H2 Zn-finger protein
VVPAQLFLALPIFSESAAPTMSQRAAKQAVFTCPACDDARFNASSEFLVHYRSEHLRAPFRCCADCPQLFETAEDVSYHESLAHQAELDRAARTHVAQAHNKKTSTL